MVPVPVSVETKLPRSCTSSEPFDRLATSSGLPDDRQAPARTESGSELEPSLFRLSEALLAKMGFDPVEVSVNQPVVNWAAMVPESGAVVGTLPGEAPEKLVDHGQAAATGAGAIPLVGLGSEPEEPTVAVAPPPDDAAGGDVDSPSAVEIQSGVEGEVATDPAVGATDAVVGAAGFGSVAAEVTVGGGATGGVGALALVGVGAVAAGTATGATGAGTTGSAEVAAVTVATTGRGIAWAGVDVKPVKVDANPRATPAARTPLDTTGPADSAAWPKGPDSWLTN